MDAESRRSRWTWRVGRIAGIGIDVHATFVLLLAWIAVSYLAAGNEVATAVRGVVLVACVFATVVLHELGHALVARRYGIATREITLYPIGGVARLDHMPELPRQELIVAVAGPLVNGAIALAIYVGLALAGADAAGTSFAVELMWINVWLGAFNLVPAFPMDGGRILRAALAVRLDRSRATALAARVGRAIAVVFAIAGVLWNPMLLVIAVFVWITATQEAAVEQLRSSLRGVSVGEAMVAEVRTLRPDASLATAAALLANSFQHDVPIVEAGQLVGMLTRDDLVHGLAARAPETPIAEVMHRTFPIAGSNEQLDSVLGRMPADGGSVLVLHDDQLVGMLDPAHLGDVVALRRGAHAG